MSKTMTHDEDKDEDENTDQIHRENTITSSIKTDMVRTAFGVLPGRATFFCFFLELPWRLFLSSQSEDYVGSEFKDSGCLKSQSEDKITQHETTQNTSGNINHRTQDCQPSGNPETRS